MNEKDKGVNEIGSYEEKNTNLNSKDERSQKQNNDVEIRVLKREFPFKRSYLIGKFGELFKAKMNKRISLYCRYDIKMEIKKGDVLKVIFPISFGSELSGEHFVVAISSSNKKSSLVIVIPLKSLKEKGINPASDLILGNIKGLNQKTSVAIINQPQTIDKYRICVDDLLYTIDGKAFQSRFKNGEEVLFYKTSYRLNDEQLKLLIQAFVYFIKFDYLKH